MALPLDVVVARVVDAGPVPAGDQPGPPDAATARELDAILTGADVAPVRLAGSQAERPDLPVPVVADEALLDAIDAPRQVRDLLDEFGLVTFGAAEELGGLPVTENGGSLGPGPGAGPTGRQVTLPDGTTHPVGDGGDGFVVGSGSWNLVDPELVDDLGVDPWRARPSTARPSRSPTAS